MKIICDVCGTTFPETATHCPICGCAKSPAAKTIPGDDMQDAQGTSTANTYAKGGRFSKNNVQRGGRSRASEGRFSGDRNRKNDTPEANKGLIAVVVVLLLAIIAVVVYIGVTVLSNLGGNPDKSGNNQPSSSYQEGNGDQSIPCTSFRLNFKSIEFEADNESYGLELLDKVPADTTDPVTYVSADPDIATVDESGFVRPGTKQGETVITVTCGTVVEECKVTSKVGEAPVEPEPEIPDVVLPDGYVLKLITYKDSGEITIAGDATAVLYKETMGIKASDITWETTDPSIATVENGKVTGVGKGYCYITAAIGDQTASCKVICTSNAAPPSDYKISHVDVTIAVGETFNLSLKNKETGANVQGIEWQASQAGIVSIDGNKITGVTVAWSGVNVFVEYEGTKYSCRIIVKPAE